MFPAGPTFRYLVRPALFTSSVKMLGPKPKCKLGVECSLKMFQTILDAVKNNQVLVISGETGCGKTTQVIIWYLHLFHTLVKVQTLNLEMYNYNVMNIGKHECQFWVCWCVKIATLSRSANA